MNRKYISFALILSLFFAQLFLVVEAGHDCNEPDCLVCAIINVISNTQQSDSIKISFNTVFVSTVLLCLVAVSVFSIYKKTLVSLKIKLSN